MHWRKHRLAAYALIVLARTIGAQDTYGSIAMSAGSATDVAGMSSTAMTVSPSLMTSGGQHTLSVAASGTRFTNRAWSASLASAFSGRGGTSAIAPTIDLAGTGALTSYSFSYLTADATPAVEGRFGGLRLFAGAHLSAASASGVIQAPTSPLGSVAPLASSHASATGATGAVGVSIEFADDNERITLNYRGERGVVAATDETDHIVSAAVGNDNVTLSALIGARTIPGTTATFGSANALLGVSQSVSIQLAAGRYPSNRLLGTPGGQFVNAGVLLRLGHPQPALPRPIGAPQLPNGMTRLSIRADDATSVEVAGEFNRWEFVPAQRAGNGIWFVDLRIAPGQYRYAFRINGKEWRIPEGMSAADDEFGGKSAWLIVTPTSGRTEQSEILSGGNHG